MTKDLEKNQTEQTLQPVKVSITEERTSEKCPIFYEPNKDGKGYSIILSGTDEKADLTSKYTQELCRITGTENKELAFDIFNRAASASCGVDHPEKANIVLQSLYEQKPRDAHEAKLCAQATVLYSQRMHYLERARIVDVTLNICRYKSLDFEFVELRES